MERAVDGTRLQLPARFREVWGAQPLVVSKGLNSCLYVQTVAEYERVVAIMSTALDPKVRGVRRFFASCAVELTPDARCRLRIGQPLLDYAKIRDRVVWRTTGACLEVWDKAALESWTVSGNRLSTLDELLIVARATE